MKKEEKNRKMRCSLLGDTKGRISYCVDRSLWRKEEKKKEEKRCGAPTEKFPGTQSVEKNLYCVVLFVHLRRQAKLESVH